MHRLILLLFTLLFCTCVPAQSNHELSLTDRQLAAIDSLVMADIPEGGPGAAVGIVYGGRVIYEKYAGLADVESGRKIDADTRFNLASNGKQFTALCILQLVEAGEIKLSDDFRDYLPEFYPSIKEPITVGQLLNHSSGIRDIYDLWSLQGITWWQVELDNDKALKLLLQQRELNFPPGTDHIYSNSNYILLAEIVAKVSGQSFREYSDHLFEKLGMTDTNFADDHTQLGENIARPYFNFDTWTTYDWKSDLYGDGALFSTLPDQLKWERTVMGKKSKMLNKDLICRSQQTINQDFEYGYGLETSPYGGLSARWHNGGTGAWKASVLRFPEEKISIVAMNNSGKFGTSTLVRDIARIVLADKLQAESFARVPEKVGKGIPVQDLAGVYATADKYYVTVEEGEKGLILKRNGRNDVTLDLEEGNVFAQTFDPDFKQEFLRQEDGTLTVTFYYPTHAPYTLTRLAYDWADYVFSALEGSYYSDEIGQQLTVEYLGERSYRLRLGEQEFEVGLYEPDVLNTGNYLVRFVRDDSGKVVRVAIDNNRVRGLSFERR